MNAVAGGMESESDSDCDIVYSFDSSASKIPPYVSPSDTSASNMSKESYSNVTNVRNQDVDSQVNYSNKKLEMVRFIRMKTDMCCSKCFYKNV